MGIEGEKLQITQPSEIQGKFQPIYYILFSRTDQSSQTAWPYGMILLSSF